MKQFLTGVLMLLLLSGVAASVHAQTTENETPAQRDARMNWWREARFGLFIHWGVYSVPAGTYKDKQIGGIGEWIMRSAEIPVTEYRTFARDFNPVKFDPAAWAALAEEAGMKYIVITSKHHDGFALFPSDVTDWDIADATPYGQDLIGPLAAATRQRGLKFGLYYSQAQDWTHPGGAKAGIEDGQGWCAEHKGRFDDYLRAIAIPQTREILTRYKPDILWWDTPYLMTRERAEPLHALLGLVPGIIANNRLGGDFAGDSDTPEQEIPETGIAGRDWETCMTMNDTWGYKSYDDNWKTPEVLIRNLVDIASKGGNYLLNIGPRPDGTIPEASIERLKAVGRWMKVNGAAIYGTTASPTRKPAWGRITTGATGDTTTLYLHVFDWPADGKLPVGIENDVVSCRLLADSTRTFKTSRAEEQLVVALTGTAPDPICSVVELTITGAPQAVAHRVAQTDDGQVKLVPADADLHGRLRVESKDGQPNIGFWVDNADWIEWNIQFGKPGAYRVVADVATMGESRLEGSITAQIPNTGDYAKFQEVELGTLKIQKAGTEKFLLRAVRDGWSPVNLRAVRILPNGDHAKQ
jgi:alpha-L-fucosidase